MKAKICCFIGHRNIRCAEGFERRVCGCIEELIVKNNVKTFLFGSKSQFNDLCYNVVSKLKTKYFDVKRVYVRSQFEYIEKDYETYLLQYYEETIFPKKCKNAGRISHVIRNISMIDESDYCLFYYDEKYLPPREKYTKKGLFENQPKSGTSLAYKYAVQKKKTIINFFEKD